MSAEIIYKFNFLFYIPIRFLKEKQALKGKNH
jgi:hypothetical protein